MDLTNTKRWNEFAHWYACNKHHYTMFLVRPINCPDEQDFINLPFEFQEGVYRKFMKSLNYCAIEFAKYWSLFEGDAKISENFKSEQEAIQYFFEH